MGRALVYLKAEKKVKVTQDRVNLGDIFKVTCTDKSILQKLKPVLIYDFASEKDRTEKQSLSTHQQKDNSNRVVISIMKVIDVIDKTGIDVEIISLGENDIVLERMSAENEKQYKIVLKVIFVSLICFFGTAFTIMAFHNDINVIGLFEKTYELFGLTYKGGAGALEIGYSIGLGVGIIVFYNHLGRRRITKDPTPLEVEMRVYEDDVNTTLIDNASRELLEMDVN